MLRALFTILLSALCATLVSFAAAAQLPADCMAVSEIRPGMKGYGKTVFTGTEIFRFEAEIIGIDKNAFPQQDIILARLSGLPVKDIGVVAGMSGSPVYINDKVIGAVAYGWSFSKEPIAGITPIENMLRVYELTSQKPHVASTDRTSVSRQRDALRLTINLENFRDYAPTLSLPTQGKVTLEPLATPLFVSHCHPALMRHLEKLFSQYDLTPVLSGNSGSNTGDLDIPIEAGSALGVEMLSGDLSFAGIGTVTYRKGDMLVAFGHPMFEMGAVDVPMTSCVMSGVMPSLARPFKLGQVARQIGSVRQDRLPAIGGVLGQFATMIPMSVQVKTAHSQEQRDFNYRVWEHKEFSPFLASMAVVESIAASDKYFGESAAKTTYHILLADGSAIEGQDFISSDFSLPFEAAMPVDMLLTRLLMNPFERVQLKSLDFRAEIIDKLLTAQIVAARTDKDVYRQGETVNVTALLRPYRDQDVTLETSFSVPHDLPDGAYTLHVCNGARRESLEYEMAPGLREARNLTQLLRQLRLTFPGNYVYVALERQSPGLTVRGEPMRSLPPTVLQALSDSEAASLTTQSRGVIISEQRLDTNFSVVGSQRLALRVSRKGRL